jgi:hypothetical protein
MHHPRVHQPGTTHPAGRRPGRVGRPEHRYPDLPATRHVDHTVTPLMAVNGAVVLLLVLLVAIITVHKIRGDHDE